MRPILTAATAVGSSIVIRICIKTVALPLVVTIQLRDFSRFGQRYSCEHHSYISDPTIAKRRDLTQMVGQHGFIANVRRDGLSILDTVRHPLYGRCYCVGLRRAATVLMQASVATAGNIVIRAINV